MRWCHAINNTCYISPRDSFPEKRIVTDCDTDTPQGDDDGNCFPAAENNRRFFMIMWANFWMLRTTQVRMPFITGMLNNPHHWGPWHSLVWVSQRRLHLSREFSQLLEFLQTTLCKFVNNTPEMLTTLKLNKNYIWLNWAPSKQLAFFSIPLTLVMSYAQGVTVRTR